MPCAQNKRGAVEQSKGKTVHLLGIIIVFTEVVAKLKIKEKWRALSLE